MNLESYQLIYPAISKGLFFGFCYAVLIGPVNALAIRRGILGGFQQAFFVGLGAALVDATCAYVVYAGFLKMGFTGAGKILLWSLCAIFLIYLAYSTLVEIQENPESTSAVRKQVQFIDHPFVMGFIIEATNPFTLFWWIGAVVTLQVPGNIDIAGGAATSFFSAVLVSELVWFFFLGMGVHHSRNLFNRKALKAITWGCGFLLLFYYVFMAIKVIMNLIHTGGASFLKN